MLKKEKVVRAFYSSTGKWRKRQHIVELLNVGGNANNGAQCGLSYANSNNGFSNSNTNIGARLNIYIEQKRVI